MAIDFTVLFTRLGKAFAAQSAVNTARSTTIRTALQAYTDEFTTPELELIGAMNLANDADAAMKSGANAVQARIRDSASRTLIETIRADATLPRYDLPSCLQELISQMVSESETVDSSTAAVSVSAVTGQGNGNTVASVKRVDGRNQELALAEVIRVECVSSSQVMRATGKAAVNDKLSHLWPGGSGISRTLNPVDASADTVLTNGGFELDDDNAGQPDDWIVSVGTVGTTLKMTSYCVQEIEISSTPTAGTYSISWENTNGKVQTTKPLAYNASGSDVQEALRELSGLALVEVSTSGTSPDFTHTVTFPFAGDLEEMTITDNTTGGAFSVTTTTTGSDHAFVGRAVEFDSNGSQLTTIQQRVTLAPLTQYAVNLWAIADVVPAAGVITVDLVNGIGGTVIQDESGTSNSFTIDCTALDNATHTAYSGVFRTPRVNPSVAYLRIRISTAVSSGTSVFLDHVGMAAMQELYAGGPSLSIFAGSKPFMPGGTAQTTPDYLTVTITNDRAGGFQEWFERNFDMRSKRLLLRSAGGGSETIDDALIA